MTALETTAATTEHPDILNGRRISMQDIQRPIEEDLKVFDQYFKEAMRSSHRLLSLITRYVLKQKGKRIRPTLVLLAAQTTGGTTPTTHRTAALVELLHTATLVHDDVVDEADRRRGLFSINALWKNKIAVLFGDFLLSKGLLLSLDFKDYRQLHLLSDAIRRMSEGELLQFEKPRHLDIDEPTYFQIISDKTASLIAACLACGAASSTQNEDEIQKMKTIGEKLGMAFQIRDDLFDFGTDDVGKPLGIDLQEKKMTLPLIYALRNGSSSERRSILKLVKQKKKTHNDIAVIHAFVHKYQGITYTHQVMMAYAEEAQTLLLTFPASPARQALIELVHYTVSRKK